MQEVAAYLLCVLGGNDSPSAADVTSVIAASGADPSEDTIATLVSDLEGKSLNDLLSEGMEKLKDVPMGGSGGAGGAGGSGGAAGGDAAEEEKEEEEEEEEAPAMGGDMFGDGGDGDY